jgi:hypothetical protein
MDTQDNNQIVEASEMETQEVGQEVEGTDVDATDSSQETTPEEFDVIKYNKEEIKIPVSERQTYLQKGYNYDKVQKQLDEAKQQALYLDRIAKRQGFENPQDFITAFEQMEKEQRIAEEAERLGLDTEVFKEYLEPMRTELEQLKQEREALHRSESERELQSEIQRLQSVYPDFEQVQDKVFDLAIAKGYELEDAYILATYQDKAKKVEQETLAKIAGRSEKQVLSSIDKPGEQIFDVNNLSSQQLREISERVQRGERIVL